MTIAFWREINPNLKYKHLEQVDYENLLEIADYFLIEGYNLMIYKRTKDIVLYVDKGRFGQS